MNVVLAVAVIALAPLLHGAMRRLRAVLAGRIGSPIIQPYLDFGKLWKKEAIVPRGARIARFVPGMTFGVACTFAACVPLLGAGSPAPLDVDIVSLVLLLGGSRFFAALAALEAGSAFTAMAASRELTFAALIEPTLLLALSGAAAAGQGTRLVEIAGLPAGVATLLALGALFIVILAETARIPIDNQETHYELTMIHEGMLLEYSGWHLALLQWSAQAKQLCFLAVAAALVPGPAWSHVANVCLLAAGVTIVETRLAKLRLFEVPQLLATAFVVAVTSIGVALLRPFA